MKVIKTPYGCEQINYNNWIVKEKKKLILERLKDIKSLKGEVLLL